MARKFYPTPSTTTYYINEYLIEDMFRIDFKRSDRKQPIYGYDSHKYDFVAQGKELVTGQIIVNFRYPGYLRNIIEEQAFRTTDETSRIHQKAFASSQEGRDSHAVYVVNQVDTLETVEAKMDYIANFLQRQEINTKSRGFINNLSVSSTTTASPSEIFTALKKNFERRNFIDSESLQQQDLEESILSSPLDSEHAPFDMVVRYGFQDRPGGYVRIFKDIQLIGEEQVVSAAANSTNDQSSSAQAILEIYPFFARTIETKAYKGA